MTQNTTPTPNVALRSSQWPQSALYEHPPRSITELCVCGHREHNHHALGCWDIANDRPFNCACTEFRDPTPARSHSDLDIERRNMIDDCMAELLTEYRANSDTTTLTIQHALIELRSAQDELQSMTGDIYGLMLLDRRLSIIRTLLEGVTT